MAAVRYSRVSLYFIFVINALRSPGCCGKSKFNAKFKGKLTSNGDSNYNFVEKIAKIIFESLREIEIVLKIVGVANCKKSLKLRRIRSNCDFFFNFRSQIRISTLVKFDF